MTLGDVFEIDLKTRALRLLTGHYPPHGYTRALYLGLALDGSGRTERLTYFNLHPGCKASNPVLSDDGRFMAFQMAKVGDSAGVGRGIFLHDFARAARGHGAERTGYR